jgi:hypothetical protein
MSAERVASTDDVDLWGGLVVRETRAERFCLHQSSNDRLCILRPHDSGPHVLRPRLLVEAAAYLVGVV